MEIELKYQMKNAETPNAIWNDKELAEMEEVDSRVIEDYVGIYYDTDTYDLLRNDIAFRIRREGMKPVASLKWNGRAKGSLHTREELNINLTDEEFAGGPKPEFFRESHIGEELRTIVGDKHLLPIMEVNVLRKTFRVDTGESLLELCIDEGEIITENGNGAVHEVEIELYSGEQADLEELGETLKAKYDLIPEQDSKFARGLKLLGKI